MRLSPPSRPPLNRRAAVALACAMLLGCATLGGCEKGTSIGAAPAADDDRAGAGGKKVSSDRLKQRGGLCDVNKLVEEPDPGSDHWVIQQLYKHALAEDEDAAFDAFFALLRDGENKRFQRQTIWPRVRKNAHKFVVDKDKVSYRICRQLETPKGMKYFIKSNDPKQHPPPIIVGPDDEGRKRILFLTPF